MLREPIDAESSARYLTLAVSAQSVVDWLISSPRCSPDDVVSEFVSSISDLTDSGTSRSTQGIRSSLSFEDLNTIYDVVAPDRHELMKKLSSLHSQLESVIDLGADPSPTTISLFRKLTEEALRRSEEPAEETSHRVLKLC